MFHALFCQNLAHLGLERLSVETGSVSIQCHQKFLMGKTSVNASLEGPFQHFGVFVVLGAEQRVHVGLDEVVEDHVQC